MNGSLNSVLERSTSVVVALPQNPTFDNVAAGLTLYLVLKDQKQTSIYCPNPMLVEFNRLVGVDRIKQEIGNRNLIIKFKNYQATDIEKVSYDIENGEFKLSVIPKENVLPPSQEQLEISLAGVHADTTIVVGGNSIADFPIVAGDLKDSQIVHVGNKAIAGGVTEILSLARSASCVSESVWKVINEAGMTIDGDTASNLLFGIEEATANFASHATNADTFQTVAELLRAGGRRKPIIEEELPLSNVPSQQLTPFFSQKKQDLALSQVEMPPQQAGKPLTQESTTQSSTPPTEWFGPKIYKGTSLS